MLKTSNALYVTLIGQQKHFQVTTEPIQKRCHCRHRGRVADILDADAVVIGDGAGLGVVAGVVATFVPVCPSSNNNRADLSNLLQYRHNLQPTLYVKILILKT